MNKNKISITCDCGVIFETIKNNEDIPRTNPFYLCHKCHGDETARALSLRRLNMQYGLRILKLEEENEKLKSQVRALQFRREKQRERIDELHQSMCEQWEKVESDRVFDFGKTI